MTETAVDFKIMLFRMNNSAFSIVSVHVGMTLKHERKQISDFSFLFLLLVF